MGWLIAAAVAAVVSATAAVIGTFVDESNTNKNAANTAEGTYNQAKSDAAIEAKRIKALKGQKTDVTSKYNLQKEGVVSAGKRNLSEENAKAGASGFDFSGIDRNRLSSINANVNAKLAVVQQNENTSLHDINGQLDIANSQLTQYNDQATFANESYKDATNFDLFDPSTWGNGSGKSLE